MGGSTSIASTNQKRTESQAENEENSVLSGFQLAAKNKKDVDENQKQTIFLTGRVHPGESNASFMVQGAIDFLLQKNNKEAKMLREQFIFKIVPMLNPDGVVNGHYRCNYTGADLNRRWPNPSKLLHPTIYYTKKLVKMCH
jgi:murein tripeptide amidase MpaA